VKTPPEGPARQEVNGPTKQGMEGLLEAA
jgi:hypothetical protein